MNARNCEAVSGKIPMTFQQPKRSHTGEQVVRRDASIHKSSSPKQPVSHVRLSAQDMVTLKELAMQWKMDRKTVRRLLAESGVRCFVFGSTHNSSIRFARSDVERFLELCQLREKQAG